MAEDQIVSGEPTANQSESAATEPANQETPAVNAETASANEDKAESQNTEKKGSEPDEEPRVRLSELKAQRKRAQEAEKRAEYYRGLADAGRQPVSEQVQANKDKTPVLDDFETLEDYAAAKARYEYRQEQAEQNKLARKKSIEEGYSSRCVKFSEETPDFQETIDNAQLPIYSDDFVVAVKESEKAPEIIYYLAKHPAEARRLATLSPQSSARELGKLEAKFDVPQARPTTNKISAAPEPINRTVTGRGPVEDSLETPAYISKRNKEVYGY